MQQSQRLFGLDLLRALAILFVLFTHFWGNTPFLNTPFFGLNLFVQGGLYILVSSGVPLFLLLTGYLNFNKQPDITFYRHIYRVILSWRPQ